MVFTDNVGRLFAGLFQTPQVSVPFNEHDFVDVNGVTITCYVVTSNNNDIIGNFPNTIQIGKGTTPATPQDEDIEDPFIAAPENAKFSMTSGVYVAGTASVIQNASLPNLGGTGDISEVVTKADGFETDTTTHNFAYTRNIVDPAVSFIANDTVNLETETVF